MLADFFGTTQPTISRVVNTWILYMADRLSYLPIWASKEQIELSTPQKLCLYQNLRIIIDCTKMYIEMLLTC